MGTYVHPWWIHVDVWQNQYSIIKLKTTTTTKKPCRYVRASQVALVVKNLPTNAGDSGLTLGWGRFPGGEYGNPHQYSCLENPMNREAWWGCKELDTTEAT